MSEFRIFFVLFGTGAVLIFASFMWAFYCVVKLLQ